MSGAGAARPLCPDLKLILLSLHDEAGDCHATLESGANVFVLQRAIAPDRVPAIEAVRAGKICNSPGVCEPALPGGVPRRF